MKAFILRHEKRLSKISFFALFLALVRTLAEPFRLQYYAADSLPFEQIKPFLMAGLLTTLALAAMVILLYYNRHKTTVLIALADIVGMVIIKYIYLV